MSNLCETLENPDNPALIVDMIRPPVPQEGLDLEQSRLIALSLPGSSDDYLKTEIRKLISEVERLRALQAIEGMGL